MQRVRIGAADFQNANESIFGEIATVAVKLDVVEVRRSEWITSERACLDLIPHVVVRLLSFDCDLKACN